MLEHLPEAHQRKAIDYVKNIYEQYKTEQASSDFYSYDVAMWIKGDSMMPAYSSGDVALIICRSSLCC